MDNIELFGSNKEAFLKEAGSCELYSPCPICNKCKVKASHLHIRCERCQIPLCVHPYNIMNAMIKRGNFKINVSDETAQEFKKMGQKVAIRRNDIEFLTILADVLDEEGQLNVALDVPEGTETVKLSYTIAAGVANKLRKIAGVDVKE